MKKVKRILAWIGIILLVCLYGSTLVCAIIDKSETQNLFKASVAATILVPILLWVYTYIFKLIKGKNEENTEEQE